MPPARQPGITLFDVNDPDQGITHVISPELGIVLPGCTLVAPDSHTCTQGAFGALAWGIGSSEAEHAMATGTLRVAKPKTMRVTYPGQLRSGVTAKDMILTLLAQYGAGGGKGHVVEFAGEAVTALDMEARMTLCNMATEFAAMSGMIAPDAKTTEYLEGRRYTPDPLPDWSELRSDDGAIFDSEIAIDASCIEPMVSWGTSPGQAYPYQGQSLIMPIRRRWTISDCARASRLRAYRSTSRLLAVAQMRACLTCAALPQSRKVDTQQTACLRWSCQVPPP